MYQSVNFSSFTDAFARMDRKDNFSYEGLEALFNYLEELEEDMGKRIKLDVIDLCCEYNEITVDEDYYDDYIGDDAHLGEYIICTLPNRSILVRKE